MTVTSGASSEVVKATETVTVTIDGVAIEVPKGTLVIRAAELLGIEIPRFCDHPLLEPVAACRMCLVDIDGVPKPQPSCAQVVTDGMQVRTQLTSPVAREAQEGVMEFLLVNHPLDCPVCDKGGECPLQNQAMSAGRPQTRFEGTKREFDKPIPVSPEILLDRERCVSCARCTRFAEQIAGDPMIELLERGAKQQVGIADDVPFDSYFSGNTVQICPVGALTAASYRFRARPFDLVSVPTGCEHCASGCALRTDYRRSTVARRLAWDDPDVNQDWNCDKGRFAFAYETLDRLDAPLIRENGQLRAASWPEAIAVAAAGLRATGAATGVLVGGRTTREDSYAYARLARGVLGTDAVDFRARLASDEEAAFLAARVAGTSPTSGAVTYRDIDAAPFVLLVDVEPEDESPIVFLRLRAAVRVGRTCIVSMAPIRSRGSAKLSAGWWPVVPATVADELGSLANGSARGDQADGVLAGLRMPGALILIGERSAGSPGALAAADRLAEATGARLAWIPRRAGERGALDAGALAGLLPGGRPLDDPAARAEVAACWGVGEHDLPSARGPMTTEAILREVTAGRLQGLLIGGLELDDLPDPRAAAAAVAAASFVVSLEQRPSVVTDLADVVLPVASVAEKSGSFANWEGRTRAFPQVLRDALTVADGAVLGMIADELGWVGGRWDAAALRRELDALGPWSGARPTITGAPVRPATAAGEQWTLVAHRLLIDAGALQTGEPHLAATARPTVAMVATGSARAATVTVTGPTGSVTLPVVEGDVAAGAVWVPLHSAGCRIYADLGVRPGDAVSMTWGGTP